ncbi:MAG: hypothetical protein WEE67_04405 [Chloroflexota bacterium]
MDDIFDSQLDAEKRQRILERLDRMVESGRLTEQEAERLHAAGDPGEFDAVVRDIRVRHAESRLAAAVADGRMSQEEADRFLERLRRGEHPRPPRLT